MSSRLAAVAGFFCPTAAAAATGYRRTAASATATSKATARLAISLASLVGLAACCSALAAAELEAGAVRAGWFGSGRRACLRGGGVLRRQFVHVM